MGETKNYFDGQKGQQKPAATETTRSKTASNATRKVSTQTITTPQRGGDRQGARPQTAQSKTGASAAGASRRSATGTGSAKKSGTASKKKSRFQKTNASNKNKRPVSRTTAPSSAAGAKTATRTVSSTQPDAVRTTRKPATKYKSAQRTPTRKTATRGTASQRQTQRTYKERPVAPASLRTQQAAVASTTTAAASDGITTGAVIETTSAVLKQSRARNKRATKGMSLKQKGSYYLAQIGPTVQTIQASPELRRMTYYVIVLLVSLLLAIHVTSLANDVLGFTRSQDNVTVTVTKDMSTNQLITALDKAGAIKHSTFCKAFIVLANKVDNGAYSDPTYLKGDYTVQPNMGIEKMLITCMNVQKQETVEVSLPEGFTIEQMAERLEEAKVCSQEDFLEACNTTDYDYDFLTELNTAADEDDGVDVKDRYHALEGYLYPDTYEFFVGESASSVVDKMLANTASKWTDAYAERASQINMTMDQVLTLASIIQKEDSNADNMAVIASVFYNRINSSSFQSLQSDATNYYVNTYIKPNVTTAEYQTYYNLYSTYQCKGLPVGPICSPGDDAIKAALWPESTNYYYFAHDDDGNLYTARTASEQSANVYNALSQ